MKYIYFLTSPAIRFMLRLIWKRTLSKPRQRRQRWRRRGHGDTKHLMSIVAQHVRSKVLFIFQTSSVKRKRKITKTCVVLVRKPWRSINYLCISNSMLHSYFMMKLSLSAPRYSKPSTLPQDSPENYEFISKIDDHAYVQWHLFIFTPWWWKKTSFTTSMMLISFIVSSKILFEGIRGQSYKGDIAIDDLSIDDSPCPPEGCSSYLIIQCLRRVLWIDFLIRISKYGFALSPMQMMFSFRWPSKLSEGKSWLETSQKELDFNYTESFVKNKPLGLKGTMLQYAIYRLGLFSWMWVINFK